MDNNNESNSVYFARLHWIIFVLPVLGLLGSMLLGIYISGLKEVSLLLCVFSLLWIMLTWCNYYFSSLTIQRKQIVFRTGVIVRQTLDIPLNKIETIDIRQSILGSILSYGALIITGTGGTRHVVPYFKKPLTCRRYIEQLMNE